MLLIGLVIFAFILFSSVNDRITSRDILSFLISSSISIVVLVLIMGILGGMGQGITIIINLFWTPDNLVLTILAIHFLALILSHFPEYFQIAISDKKGKYEWLKSKSGLVYYMPREDYVADEEDIEDAKSDIYISFFRREIGVMTYVIWINVLLTVYNKIYDPIKVMGITILGCALLIMIHYYFESQKKSIDKSENLVEANKKKKQYLRLFQLFFWLHLVLIVFICAHVHFNTITKWNLILLMILTYQGALLYILFRVFRGWFKHFRKPDGQVKDGAEGLHVRSIVPFYHMSDIVTYLTVMQVTGIFFSLLLLLAIIFPVPNVNGLNPVPVFVIILIIYYSAIVIGIKHYLYHNKRHYNHIKASKEDQSWTKNKWIAMFFSFSPLIFLGYLIYGTIQSNDLHTLKMVDENKNTDVVQFIDHLKIDTTLNSHFIIGSYGGGLKANAWTMLVLRELEEQIGRNFIESTLCMSGVSGGALGLGNYTMISRYINHKDNEAWDKVINEIGSANILSSDLTGWLIKDLYREPIPRTFNGNDRANESMLNYKDIIGDEYGDKQSFRDYWTDTYYANDTIFPAILINTTPTMSYYGLACSIRGLDKFPISIDILDHPKKRSLTYLHFVDGGYFDNSGLLNARSFYKQLEQHDSFRSKKRDHVYALNIMNDKANYILSKSDIRAKIEKLPKNEPASGEFSSILGGIAALERMPITLEMPYRISLKDIEKAYNTSGLKEKDFEDLITENNRMIEEALDDAR